MKSNRSESVKSVKSSNLCNSTAYIPPEFEVILSEACKRYFCPFTINVRKMYQENEYVKRSTTGAKVKRRAIQESVSQTDEDTKTGASPTNTSLSDILDENPVRIISIYDNMNNLVSILIDKVELPHKLMQILALLAGQYEYLYKLYLNKCRIDAYILRQINEIIGTSSITELILDGARIFEENLCDLLDNENGHIRHLSLSGCQLSNEICKSIAKRLHFSMHAEKTLSVLNLCSNHITDEGAKYFGEALRSNRHLRYLNLSDNRICDDGAICIFNALIEFQLTREEIFKKRQRFIEYLKDKQALLRKIVNSSGSKTGEEWNQVNRILAMKRKKTPSASKGQSKKALERKDKMSISGSILDIITEMMGPFVDPFTSSNVVQRGDDTYCLGNMVLCYLNLSYNHLLYHSVKKLLNVLEYQRIEKKQNQTGLMKIVIEGNDLPSVCPEYQVINDLIRTTKANMPFGSGNTSGRRKSKTAIVTLGK